MKIVRFLSVAVLMGHVGLGFGMAEAQGMDLPAEIPPSSYQGTQYVDSKGCVFVRAGVDGAVTWVPRMTRSRQQICNAKPTFAGGQAPIDTARAAAVAAAPRIVPPAAVAAAVAAPAPARAAAPAPRPMAAQPRSGASAPPVRRATAPVVIENRPAMTAAPAPRRVIAAQPMRPMVSQTPVILRPAVQPANPRRIAVPAQRSQIARAPMVQGAGGCRWASGTSAQVMRGQGVRCGPQAVPPVPFQRGQQMVATALPQPYAPQVQTYGTAPLRQGRQVIAAAAAQQTAVRISPTTRIAPRHVVQSQAQWVNAGVVPTGYRNVWEDDRLNPYRAHQTLAGKAAMEQRWTRSVPRELVPAGDVGPVFNPDHALAAMAQTSYGVQGRAYVSSQGRAIVPRAAAPAPVRVGVTHRFVQAGVYGSEAAARAEASRLARTGLSVRISTSRQGGAASHTVLAGPYASPQALGNALHRARQAGFAGAVTR